MVILIYACAIAATQPGWCSTHPLIVPAEHVTHFACAKSQAHVAQWAMQNPGWQVKRWNCKRIEVAEVQKWSR